MEDKTKRRIVIEPLILLLKSRRVLIGLSGLLTSGLVGFAPQLEPLQGELLTIITAITLFLIGGFAYEDAAIAGRNQNLREAKEYALEMVEAIIENRIEEQKDGS